MTEAKCNAKTPKKKIPRISLPTLKIQDLEDFSDSEARRLNLLFCSIYNDFQVGVTRTSTLSDFCQHIPSCVPQD